jgi:hypothetical protein
VRAKYGNPLAAAAQRVEATPDVMADGAPVIGPVSDVPSNAPGVGARGAALYDQADAEAAAREGLPKELDALRARRRLMLEQEVPGGEVGGGTMKINLGPWNPNAAGEAATALRARFVEDWAKRIDAAAGLDDKTKARLKGYGSAAAAQIDGPEDYKPAIEWAGRRLDAERADDTRNRAVVVNTGSNGRDERGEQRLAIAQRTEFEQRVEGLKREFDLPTAIRDSHQLKNSLDDLKDKNGLMTKGVQYALARAINGPGILSNQDINHIMGNLAGVIAQVETVGTRLANGNLGEEDAQKVAEAVRARLGHALRRSEAAKAAYDQRFMGDDPTFRLTVGDTYIKSRAQQLFSAAGVEGAPARGGAPPSSPVTAGDALTGAANGPRSTADIVRDAARIRGGK